MCAVIEEQQYFLWNDRVGAGFIALAPWTSQNLEYMRLSLFSCWRENYLCCACVSEVRNCELVHGFELELQGYVYPRISVTVLRAGGETRADPESLSDIVPMSD